MDKHQPLLIFRTFPVFWMICAGVLMVNLLIYFLSVRPAEDQIAALQRQWMAERDKKPKSHKKDDVLKEYLNAKKALQAFQNRLPEEKEAPAISQKLAALLQREGVTSEAVRLVPKDIDDLFMLKYKADIVASGAYADIKKVLADIQNSPILFCIEKMSLDYESGFPHQVKLQLTLSTYFKNSGKEQPDAG